MTDSTDIQQSPGVIPVVRSFELFSQMDDAQRDMYFDTVASAPASMVAPEAVFGTNGWARRLAETRADPVVAKRAFDVEWESLDQDSRAALLFANAADRFFMSGVDEEAQRQLVRDGGDVAASYGVSNPAAGIAMESDPSLAASAMMAAMFGKTQGVVNG